MTRLGWRSAIGAVIVLAVTACGPSTKEDLLAKARNVATRAELEQALGKPSDIAKLGPIETWTYRASNGEVVFLIVDDRVTLQAAGGAGRRN